jgi:hypothetical protein
VWEKTDRQALVGCQAKALVAPTRWTLLDRYRVWALSCPAIGFEVGLKETLMDLRVDQEISEESFLVIPFLLFFPLCVVVFLRERRGVL